MNNYSDEIKQEIEALKKHVKIRDQMGGALYYNIINDECCEKANALSAKGVNKEEISNILGKGTHIKH